MLLNRNLLYSCLVIAFFLTPQVVYAGNCMSGGSLTTTDFLLVERSRILEKFKIANVVDTINYATEDVLFRSESDDVLRMVNEPKFANLNSSAAEVELRINKVQATARKSGLVATSKSFYASGDHGEWAAVIDNNVILKGSSGTKLGIDYSAYDNYNSGLRHEYEVGIPSNIPSENVIGWVELDSLVFTPNPWYEGTLGRKTINGALVRDYEEFDSPVQWELNYPRDFK